MKLDGNKMFHFFDVLKHGPSHIKLKTPYAQPLGSRPNQLVSRPLRRRHRNPSTEIKAALFHVTQGFGYDFAVKYTYLQGSFTIFSP